MFGTPKSLRAGRLLLAIESTCDETAAAVIDRDLRILSNVVMQQAELHRIYGGVVPEIASRAHVQKIVPAIDEALRAAGIRLDELSAVAVASRPGLVGSLLVGLTAAKTLSLVLGIPLVDVNHVEAHLYACRLSAGREVFPAVGLVASGGHTLLFDCASSTDFQLLGTTLDDAAGEAFDKGAKILGLDYPGGPAIERSARGGDATSFRFPRPMLDANRLDFSFSGLKTALLYEVEGGPQGRTASPALAPSRVADLAAAYQEAIVDVLVAKSARALVHTGRNRLCVGGGVAANGRLRQRLSRLADEAKVELFIASRELCTDNAAMAAMAWEFLECGAVAPLDLDVTPGLWRGRKPEAGTDSSARKL